ncbi:glycoside hydrolase TIM-barrel-like domain-containing protein [soil metagenome]
MAQVVLGGIGGVLGGGIGRAIGGALGGIVDRGLIGSLQPSRQSGPRLETLRLQSSADGAPMACAFGRARVTGQVIWAARFLEGRNETRGGKGGPKIVDYDYSLSFAVALCEGPIDGVGRVWADGQPLDLSGVTMRVHRGDADQTPDPLIEAVESVCPAYRGTAYVVFEDLALGLFGDRVPQLSFEVFRRPEGDGLEERLEGVCLIPGAGEFMLATEAVLRREGLTRTTPENLHNGEGRPDLLVSLDQLAAQCPNLKRVSLVVGWFGDDLRAGHCRVRPGVERRDKPTEPLVWSVAGLDRSSAHLISENGGAPAYGGTPTDESVRQAVAALKARGWAVTLYPFVFMDIAADNALLDPYGGVAQAAYPWRGRIRGEDGPTASGQVGALFGDADDWGLTRLALHYAALVAETGADGLLIGSEMRGLTWTRDEGGNHPAVAQYCALAEACRTIVGPDVALSYAADWSEYFAFHPTDGSGDVVFHLDPLWSHADIDHVGIDWYPPLGDWRDGDGGIDAVTWPGPSDAAYLAAQVAGGEGFDWYYADDADRVAQVRTPIEDTAYGEDWIYRPKDLVGWWSHAHHDRVAGVRRVSATDWVPGMKPIRLTEFGCAAVDRGGNAPNLFIDPKSAESRLPPASTGARDDRMQRGLLEATLGHFGSSEHNPISSVYGGPMLDGADAWCWDARPFPAFPARVEVWADAGAWRTGHWLNGRLSGETAALLAALLRRGGLSDDMFRIEAPVPQVEGYVVDRPMRTRDAIAPLVSALGLAAVERDGGLTLVQASAGGVSIDRDALAIGDGGGDGIVRTRSAEARPSAARVRYIDEAAEYQTGSVVVRGVGDGGGVDIDLPAVCGIALAEAVAGRALGGEDEVDTLILSVGPLEAIRLETGDTVRVEGQDGAWRIDGVSLDETPTATLSRARPVVIGDAALAWRPGDPPAVVGAPFFRVLDLPLLPGQEDDERPVVAVAVDPWRSMRVFAGVHDEALPARGDVGEPASIGRLITPLHAGPRGRWDIGGALVVQVEGRVPESRTDLAVLAGGNAVAIETAAGWEIVQFASATLIGSRTWRLSRLLRAQQGTDAEMSAGAEVGNLVVFLDGRTTRASAGPAERGLPLIWRAGPRGTPAGGAGFSEIDTTLSGTSQRPWAPAHLSIRSGADGLQAAWIARSRRNGDAWELDVASDPDTFHVRVMNGPDALRSLTVEAAGFAYASADIATDFPAGITAGAWLGVSQFNPLYGWGTEASVGLSA